MEVAGRVVVVTGAAGGIGRALCRRFRDQGAGAIVVADRDRAGAEAVAAELSGLAVPTDVTKEAEVQALVESAVSAFGPVDIYCSNAGIAFSGGEDAPDEAWNESWRVHVLAHVYAARAVLPGMMQRGEGYFLGTISAAALLNHVLAAPYAATKAAGLSFLEWLALAYGARGIHVSAICPQGVRTPMLGRETGSSFLHQGALEPDTVAALTLEAMREERFLILPHPEVEEYFQRKASDYDRWLRGMGRLRARVLEEPAD